MLLLGVGLAAAVVQLVQKVHNNYSDKGCGSFGWAARILEQLFLDKLFDLPALFLLLFELLKQHALVSGLTEPLVAGLPGHHV